MPAPPVNLDKLLPAFRQAALAAPLTALADWWVHVSCARCRGRSTSFGLRLMVQRHGRGTLAAAVARLRCQECHCPPTSVQLTDDPAAGTIGAIPPSWRVELLPLDPPDNPAHRLPGLLELTCGCTDQPPCLVPLVAVAQSWGGRRQTLGGVISRLRCSRCHLRPVTVALREAMIRPGAEAPELGWSLPLPAPPPAPRLAQVKPSCCTAQNGF